MIIKKPHLSFWQIINMNVGFFGIQYSFALQQNAVNPIYKFLGAENGDLPMLQIAGPVTGLLIQPIIGALSDKTWHPKFGRRKPYFLIGAVLCSICLFLFPFSQALWMAVGLLWILDAANNTAMEPYRAFVADKLDSKQQPTGFLAQSFFTGFGQTLGTLSLFLFQLIPFLNKSNANNIPYWVFASFFFGAFCSITSIMWSNKTTPEIPPTAEELNEIQLYNKNGPHPFIQLMSSIIVLLSVPLFLYFLLHNYITGLNLNLLTLAIFIIWITVLYKTINAYSSNSFVKKIGTSVGPFMEIISAVLEMPKNMWRLFFVYLFQWFALKCYWDFKDLTIAKSIFHTTDNSAANKVYQEAVGWGGLISGWTNIITFVSAFALVWFARKIGAKLVHFTCLLLAAMALFIFPHVSDKFLVLIPLIGFGIAWASMMGVPYLLIVNDIPKSRYGVYMGIINMMIVIPMIIYSLSFGAIFNNFLGKEPINAIYFGAFFLLISAALTLLIKTTKPSGEITMPAGGGH
jgi:maltose/moltooligosaccharide transporter